MQQHLCFVSVCECTPFSSNNDRISLFFLLSSSILESERCGPGIIIKKKKNSAFHTRRHPHLSSSLELGKGEENNNLGVVSEKKKYPNGNIKYSPSSLLLLVCVEANSSSRHKKKKFSRKSKRECDHRPLATHFFFFCTSQQHSEKFERTEYFLHLAPPASSSFFHSHIHKWLTKVNKSKVVNRWPLPRRRY